MAKEWWVVSMAAPDGTLEKARKLSLLGIILQALHPLFGITAVIGFLVAITSKKSTEGTLYQSHIKWQIVTFWFGFVGYAVAFFLWSKLGITWPVVLVFLFIAYRVFSNINRWLHKQALERPI